ncbi:DUF6468 domain-containing protein [Roseomonas xinghualingensis]|uniref:DUF6468 domain-containing protein n=1 Tax=Roseomonas xinghualingensis TaxID=2986475 RepID=UPI0021F15EF2|nr:DUF6468 domain-containing protein [Roseomonas sp. SXEYE001]MCV4208031.1 DUF6468 domain-containing protein [Roseomonas sp. SXEYE001]
MSHAEWILQGALLALLVAALPFAVRLERGLAALRRDRSALADGAQGFEAVTREAQLALSGLRGALETQARQVAMAETLREDLRFLVERAERLADRLEGLVRQGRPAASQPAGTTEEAVPRSQAERDLLQALRMVR